MVHICVYVCILSGTSGLVSSAADLARYKQAIRSALREFVANVDNLAFGQVVRDLDMTVYHQDLGRIIVLFGLDQSPQGNP